MWPRPPFPGPPLPGPYGPPPPGMIPGGYLPRPPGPPPGMMPPSRPALMTPHNPAPTAGTIAGVKRLAAYNKPSSYPERPVTSSSADKSTMVSVGKIAATVDNKVMLALLEACGPVKSWKRAEDPETKALKGFGFCEYQDAEGVLRAIRLLDKLKVDSQELVIKANSATQRYVDEYESSKQRERQAAAAARLEAERKKQEEGEVVDESALEEAATSSVVAEEQAAEHRALEVIMGIVSEREEASARRASEAGHTSSATAAAAAELLQQVERGELRLPGPPPRAGETEAGQAQGRDRERERDARESRERDRERDAERDRQRAADREYDQLLHLWERHERRRNDALERERAMRDMSEKERWRQCRADVEVSDSEEEVAWWGRRPYRGSRRCMERWRRRQEEEEGDALDRQREQRELEAAAERKRKRQEEGLGDDEGSDAQGHHHSLGRSRRMSAGGQEVKAEPSEASAAPQKPASPEVDEADPIYKAMMAAATSAPRQHASNRHPSTGSANPLSTTRPGDRLLHHATHDPHAAIKSGHRSAFQGSESPPPSSTSAARGAVGPAAAGAGVVVAPRQRQPILSNVFGDEDDEGSSRRVLRPIQYSEEELKAVEEMQREREAAEREEAAAAAAAASTGGAAAGSEAGRSAGGADNKAVLKALMDRIPTSKQDVWSYSIKWSQYNEVMKQRFSKWVDAKVAQLLGEPDQAVVGFILDLIGQHKSPAATMSELESLLDSDTETFVIKLYRTVIFETERAAAGL